MIHFCSNDLKKAGIVSLNQDKMVFLNPDSMPCWSVICFIDVCCLWVCVCFQCFYCFCHLFTLLFPVHSLPVFTFVWLTFSCFFLISDWRHWSSSIYTIPYQLCSNLALSIICSLVSGFLRHPLSWLNVGFDLLLATFFSSWPSGFSWPWSPALALLTLSVNSPSTKLFSALLLVYIYVCIDAHGCVRGGQRLTVDVFLDYFSNLDFNIGSLTECRACKSG